MDLVSALSILSRQPVQAEHGTAVLPGAWLPLVLPLTGLSPRVRADWLLALPDAPLDDRVSAALAGERVQQAWDLVIATPAPLTSIGRLDLVLSLWQAQEFARLGLPAPGGPVLVCSDTEVPHLAEDAVSSLRLVQDLLSPLPWPRWSGPLLLVVDHPHLDPFPGQDRLLRPAAPGLRLLAPPAGQARRELLCAQFALLALDLTAPPRGGWPAWLGRGLAEVARAKGRDGGPSPVGMQALRHDAGAAALRAVLLSAQPDPSLAGAICAYLTHPRRRAHLANLLELLRHGIPAEGALHVAYDVTIEKLLTDR